MNEYYAVISSDSYLAHYGVKGMKWGIRRTRKDLKYDKGSILSIVNKVLKANPGLKTVEITGKTGPGKEIFEEVLPKVYNLTISSISNHAAERASQRKVSVDDILDTVYNAVKDNNKININSAGKPSIRLIGEKSVINVNPKTNEIVTLWSKIKRK